MPKIQKQFWININIYWSLQFASISDLLCCASDREETCICVFKVFQIDIDAKNTLSKCILWMFRAYSCCRWYLRIILTSSKHCSCSAFFCCPRIHKHPSPAAMFYFILCYRKTRYFLLIRQVCFLFRSWSIILATESSLLCQWFFSLRFHTEVGEVKATTLCVVIKMPVRVLKLSPRSKKWRESPVCWEISWNREWKRGPGRIVSGPSHTAGNWAVKGEYLGSIPVGDPVSAQPLHMAGQHGVSTKKAQVSLLAHNYICL